MAACSSESGNTLNNPETCYHIRKQSYQKEFRGFPGGAVVEDLPADAGDTGSSPGLGRSHMPRSD